jgi:hypothetical protein
MSYGVNSDIIILLVKLYTFLLMEKNEQLLEELTLKIALLEDEVKFIRQKLDNNVKQDFKMYQQLMDQYSKPIEPVVILEKKITHNEKEYVVDKNNFLWDSDGYVCGWLNDQMNIILKD